MSGGRVGGLGYVAEFSGLDLGEFTFLAIGIHYKSLWCKGKKEFKGLVNMGTYVRWLKVFFRWSTYSAS